MPSAKKSTSLKAPTERTPGPRERRPQFSKAVGARLWQALHAQTPRWSPQDLAEHLGILWGQDKPPYSRVNGFLSGGGSFGALALYDISEALDVSTDWLLTGEGPMWRGQRLDYAGWVESFTSDIQRRVFQRVRWPSPESPVGDEWQSLERHHIELDVSAILDDLVTRLANQFIADASDLLSNEAKERTANASLTVLSEFVQRLPLAEASAANEAMRTLIENSLQTMYALDMTVRPIGLTEGGVASLMSWWMHPGVPSAERALVTVARRQR